MANHFRSARRGLNVLIALCLTVGVCWGPGAVAQTESALAADKSEPQILRVSSTRAKLVASGAHYIRLHFPGVSLPPGVSLRVSDASRQSWQRFDEQLFTEWSNSTAYFNGDTVIVELEGVVKDKQTGQPAVDVMKLLEGVRVETQHDSRSARGAAKEMPGIIIGEDNRVHSKNAATGRIMPMLCTGWLISAGVGLSAGHCFEEPQDRQNLVLQFNVPPSVNGVARNPPASDQFPIEQISLNDFQSAGPTSGNDWGVFRIRRNAATGASVFAARQAFFRLSAELRTLPVHFVTVTGYGRDTTPPGPGPDNKNAATYTEQESIGSLLNTVRPGGNRVVLAYDADTMPGNSGSPVHLPGILTAIGIHDGGFATEGPATCGQNNNACNFGSGFDNNDLINTIGRLANSLPPGVNPQDVTTRFIDTKAPSWVVPADGTILRPYRNIQQALIPAFNTPRLVLNIVAGYYAGRGLTINKPRNGRSIILRAVAGEATLGPVPRPVPLRF